MENYKLYKLLKSVNNGTDTTDATVTPTDLVEGVTAYGPNGKIEGTIPDKRGSHAMGYQKKPYIPNGWSSVWVDLKPGPMAIDDGMKYQIHMPFTDMADTIGLTADKLKAGETVLEMEGTFTADADGEAQYLLEGKTAYVNGEKIIGTLRNFQYGGIESYYDELTNNSSNTGIQVKGKPFAQGYFYVGPNTSIKYNIYNDELAELLELTPEKLVKGNTILGIEGTAETVAPTTLKLTSGAYLFSNNARTDNETEIVEYLDSITDATSMYEGNTILTSLDLSRIDFSNCTKIIKMCYNCSNIAELNLQGCDFHNVIEGGLAFSKMGSLTILDLSNLDFSKATDINGFLESCGALASINLTNCNFSSVKNLSCAFAGTGLTEIDLSTCSLNNVTNLYQTFNCTFGLKTINLSNCDLSKVTNARNMCYYSTVKEIIADQLNLSKVTDFSSAFYSTGITTLPEIDGSSMINIENAFRSCNQLTNFGGIKNIGKAYTQTTANYAKYKLDFTYDTSLSHDSLMNIINNLYDLNLTYDVANGGTLYTQQLVLTATNLAKLTEEEIAIATNKGWTVS